MRPRLAAYSPLHNIHPGRSYPATLITTHEHDPRVGETHSHRFAQALQAAQSGPAPILLRVDPGSGHATQDTSAERLAATTDRLTFLAIQLGLFRLGLRP
jgi:prolyl oligopeptidase